jgi:aspartyl protease family protein
VTERLGRALLVGAFFLAATSNAWSTNVSLVGVVGSSAVVSIDNSPPHVMAAGATVGNVTLVSVAGDHAMFMIDGKRESVGLGQFYGGSPNSGRQTAVLTATSNGAFMATGTINGQTVTFMADTGASLVVMSSTEADRLGIRWRDQPTGQAQSANGMVSFHHVVLPTIKVGEIVLNNIDAAIQEQGLGSMALLGQSFLNRTEMSRSGSTMTLVKRF